MLRKKSFYYSVSIIGLLIGATGGAFGQATEQTPETVTVTGIRASLEKGLEIKRESSQVVEAVVAEDIGKLPDNNVVEALQRLTGVQVTDRGSGQVGTLSIRGLTDVETTWNGRRIFTASGLYFSIQDMPATLVSRLEVYKTRASHQIETGLGGQIDVTSYRPFDFDGFKFSTQVQVTNQELRGSVDPSISALVSDRWKTGIGDIGISANLSWSVVRFRDESSIPGAMVPFMTTNPPTGWGPLERIFNNDPRVPSSVGANPVPIWQPGLIAGLPEAAGSTMNINGTPTPYYLSRDAIFQFDGYGKRTRPNANVAVQWAPDTSSLYTVEVLYNGYRNELYNDLLFSFVDSSGDFRGNPPRIDPTTSYTLFPGTNVVKSRHVGHVYGFNSGDITSSKTDSIVLAANGKWDVGQRLKLVADFSYQTSAFDSQFFAMRTDRVAPDVFVDYNADGAGYMGFNFGTTQNLITQPGTWNTNQVYDNANHNKGEDYTATFDGVYDLDGVAGPFKDVKFGIRYDDRGAREASRQADDARQQNLATFASSIGSGLVFTNQNFFDGRAPVPDSWVNVSGRFIYENRDAIRQLWGGRLLDPRLHEMFQTFKIDETNTTAYVESDLEQDVLGHPLKLNAGLRYVQVKDSMTFFDRTQFLVDGSHNATYGLASVAKVLPSATLSYEPADDLKFLVNYGETLRRPAFTALNPTYALNADVTHIGYATGTRGNPSLRPTHAKSIDITGEWYFAPNSALYGTLFRRDIDDLVVNQNVSLVIPGAAVLTQYNTNNFIINEPLNASKGSLKGIEVGTVYFPDFLPSYLDGFGVQGSLTVLSSSQNVPQTDTFGNVVSELRQEFLGVSPLSYNTTLIYENGDFGARMSYVWRSKEHNGNSGANFANPLGMWRKAESSLDLQLSYKVMDNTMLTFDAVNLLNGVQQTYYNSGGNGSALTTPAGTLLLSRSFSVGLRFSN